MRSMSMALTAALSLSLLSFGANAMPAQVAADVSAASPQVILVAQGCGRGFARGPAGGCRPIGRVVVVGRPAVVVARPVVVVRRPAVVVRPGCGVRVGPLAVRTPC